MMMMVIMLMPMPTTTMMMMMMMMMTTLMMVMTSQITIFFSNINRAAHVSTKINTFTFYEVRGCGGQQTPETK